MYAAITTDPIDTAAVLARVGADEDGAVLLFLGTVRDHNEGRPVRGIRYEAYRDMAEAVLREIAGEAESRAGGRVAVVHRVGELVVGDPSVAIAVSTPHRAEAYEASRYVIEEIKKRLPIWKEERYADGSEAWVEGTRPPAPEAAGAKGPARPAPEPEAAGAKRPARPIHQTEEAR